MARPGSEASRLRLEMRITKALSSTGSEATILRRNGKGDKAAGAGCPKGEFLVRQVGANGGGEIFSGSRYKRGTTGVLVRVPGSGAMWSQYFGGVKFTRHRGVTATTNGHE